LVDLVHQGEVSRTFLSRTFRGMRGSEKKNYIHKSAKTTSFSLQRKIRIQCSIITEDVGWKRNHCNAKQSSNTKKSAKSI